MGRKVNRVSRVCQVQRGPGARRAIQPRKVKKVPQVLALLARLDLKESRGIGDSLA